MNSNDETPNGDAPRDIDAVGGAERSEPDRPQPEPSQGARADKGRLHRTHVGILSKHPLQALAHSGENIRELRRIERALRIELKPCGNLGKILFDRAWSSYLRCVLIAHAETDLLSSENRSAETTLPTLRAGHMPTLVYTNEEIGNLLPTEVLKYLAVTQRYDAHFWREFCRYVGMLLALRDAGTSGLIEQIKKAFGPNKDLSEASDV